MRAALAIIMLLTASLPARAERYEVGDTVSVGVVVEVVEIEIIQEVPVEEGITVTTEQQLEIIRKIREENGAGQNE